MTMTIKDINKIKKGDRITVSDHPSATWFKVINIGRYTAEIKEADMYRSQFIDKFIIRKVKGE